MNIAEKNDTVIMLKIRANLYSLASYCIEQDYEKARQMPRYHRKVSATKPKMLILSRISAEAFRFWKMSEEDVWSVEEEKQIKRFYNAKRKSGEMEKAIVWERPKFKITPSCNIWRARLHGLA